VPKSTSLIHSAYDIKTLVQMQPSIGGFNICASRWNRWHSNWYITLPVSWDLQLY